MTRFEARRAQGAQSGDAVSCSGVGAPSRCTASSSRLVTAVQSVARTRLSRMSACEDTVNKRPRVRNAFLIEDDSQQLPPPPVNVSQVSQKAKKVLGIVSAKEMKKMGQAGNSNDDLAFQGEHNGQLWRMLVVLKDGVFETGTDGGPLARDLRHALRAGVPILLAHETSSERGGRPFEQLIRQVPADLVATNLFTKLSTAIHARQHFEVSTALIARELCEGTIEGVMHRQRNLSLSNLREDRSPRSARPASLTRQGTLSTLARRTRSAVIPTIAASRLRRNTARIEPA